MNPYATVFLCGMPRSGTTWLGKIFDSHPATFYLHEPDSEYRINEVPLFPDSKRLITWQPILRDFHNTLPKLRSTKTLGKMPLFPKTYFSPFSQHLLKGNIYLSKISSRLSVNLPIANLAKEGNSQTTLVWKSIESVGRFGIFMNSIDDLKGILILRHPCGYAASVLRGEAMKVFDSEVDFHADEDVFRQLAETKQAQRRELSLSAFKAMQPIQRMAWAWVLNNEKALEDCTEKNTILPILYEDVCADPIAQTKRMFDFAGLEWQAQTEQFLKQSISTEKDDYYSVYKNPTHSVNKWKESLQAEQINAILDILETSSLKTYYPS